MRNYKRYTPFLYLCALLCALPLGAHSATLHNLQIAEVDQSTHITLNFDARPQYKTLILANPPRFVVDLLHTVPAKRNFGAGTKNAFVKSIRTAPKEGKHYRIVFDLVAGIQKTSVQTLSEDATQLTFKLNYPAWFSTQPRTPEQVGTPPSADTKKTTGTPPKPNAIKQIDKTQLRDALIMIDPGHGGKDPGATGASGSLEKNIVLSTALTLQRMLNREYGIKALLTRQNDRFVDLRKRLDAARTHQADLFISLHADAFHHSNVRGASVYVLSDKGASSEAARILAQRENKAVVGGINIDDKDNALASILVDLSQTASMGRAHVLGNYILAGFGTHVRSKGIESAGFLVLKSPDVPSVLVELGYLTNPEEEKLLRQPTYQTRLAKNIVGGIKRYLNDYATADMHLAHTAIRNHTVAKGDTLYTLAKRFNTQVHRIKQLSGINTNTIHVGQILKVPIMR